MEYYFEALNSIDVWVRFIGRVLEALIVLVVGYKGMWGLLHLEAGHNLIRMLALGAISRG